MPTYPALDQMGIKRPQEITRYTLSHHRGEDILRIVYKRQAGSLLPATKRFHFPRHEIFDKNTGQMIPTDEISPALTSALDELNSILSHEVDHDERKAAIVSELEELEKFVQLRMSEIRADLEKLD